MDATTLLPSNAKAARRRGRTPDRRRRALEQDGWRTWLTYRENHRRDGEGRMLAVEERWVVEMERRDGAAWTVEAASPAAAWTAAWRFAVRVSRREEAPE